MWNALYCFVLGWKKDFRRKKNAQGVIHEVVVHSTHKHLFVFMSKTFSFVNSFIPTNSWVLIRLNCLKTTHLIMKTSPNIEKEQKKKHGKSRICVCDIPAPLCRIKIHAVSNRCWNFSNNFVCKYFAIDSILHTFGYLLCFA